MVYFKLRGTTISFLAIVWLVVTILCFATVLGLWGYHSKIHQQRFTRIPVNQFRIQKTSSYITGESKPFRKTHTFEEIIQSEPLEDISWKSTTRTPSFRSKLPSGTILKEKKHYKRVAFLKTHKCGSSTVQNILLRYGEVRNLTFLLSKLRKGHYDNVIGIRDTLNDNNTLPPPPNKTFDILCCHVLYNRDAFQKYMGNDTAYIAIVREPFYQFLSTLNYFGSRRIFTNNSKYSNNAGYKVLQFLKDPWRYEQGIKPYMSFINNRMAVEFDFPAKLFLQYSKEESAAYLNKLDREFELVIVLECFIESIVLMRRILRWSIKDVLFFNKNVANRDYSFVDDTHRYMYENFAKLDYDLYKHFYLRLWEHIRREGMDFHLELLYFKRLRREIEDYCEYHSTEISSYSVQSSIWSESFNVTHTDCKLLGMHEAAFVAKIRKRQYG